MKIVQLTWKLRQIAVSFQFSKQNENCRYVNKENIDFVMKAVFSVICTRLLTDIET